jgi:hypothetical protein
MGVYIGQSTKIYDRATGERQLRPCPAGSVVVPGSLPKRRWQVQPVLRGDRQAGRCADPCQDQHQRAAARLNLIHPPLISDFAAQLFASFRDHEATSMSTRWNAFCNLMADKKASDVYLSAHAPALIKINGQCLPINSQILPVEATRQSAGRGGAAEPD